jgi:hypothetical protein
MKEMKEWTNGMVEGWVIKSDKSELKCLKLK